MNKKIFVYAAVAALAASSVALAQVRSGGAVVEGGHDQVAAKETRLGMNPAQEAMGRHFSSLQLQLLDLSTTEDQKSGVILAMNVAFMWIQTPTQQENTKKNFLELDKYRPGKGPWDAVRQAPSKVQLLLALSPAQVRAIDAAEAVHSKEWMRIATSDVAVATKLKEHIDNDEWQSRAIEAALDKDQKKEWSEIRSAGMKLIRQAFDSKHP